MAGSDKPRWLVPKDHRTTNWILREDDPVNGTRVRTEYEDLQCPQCLKVDEDQAILRGLPKSIVIRSTVDYLSSGDDFIVVSNRFVDFCEAEGIVGFRLARLTDKYTLLLPGGSLAIFDPISCGAEFLRPCKTCGRFRETVGLFAADGLLHPIAEKVILSIAPSMESTRGRSCWFLTSCATAKILKSAKMKGLDIDPLY